MSVKAFILMAPLALGGLYFSGALSASFSREVDRTPAQVAAAIADLDIRRQPGSPGTDPAASGGVVPVFNTERSPNAVTFTVWSRDKVATRMIAHLEPLDGGRRTRLTAEVVRGDAPDELIAPAFRSTGVTLGLFAAALGDEIDDLLSPPRLSRAECVRLEEELLLANAPVDGNPAGAITAVARTGRELRRRGCDTRSRANEPFRPISNRMGDPPPEGTSFERGRPMVDVGRDRDR